MTKCADTGSFLIRLFKSPST
ncbi:hypothetical protein Gotur_000377, partial [Gossypium turneri]